MLTRLVTQEYKTDLGEAQVVTKSFSTFLEVPNLILLGDPGAGKSFLFADGSGYENGRLYTARNFVIYADESCTGKVLYIDALDEKRSRTNSSQSIDELVKKIIELRPSKLRLSCRAADWLGETDLELFKPYFESSGGYCVVSLEALTDEEGDQILHQKGIEKPKSFRKEAELRGVSFLLKNPQTLIMLTGAVHGGEWPSTKKDLYQKATEILLTEHNANHTRTDVGELNAELLFEAAGASCASALIADVAGISLLKSVYDIDCPSYVGIPYDNAVVLGALTRKAFVGVSNEAVNYTHRTIAEFLGACWLAKSVRSGLPIGRIRSLICVEGCPAPELRGLHAWLATVLPEHAITLIKEDPYGVLLYGDVATLSAVNRRALLDELAILSTNDPWFRSHELASEQLGSLSGQDMIESFKNVLSSNPERFYLRSIVLDAIKYGPPVPDLLEDLRKILCNENAPYGERKNAFEALIQAVPNSEGIIIEAVKKQMNGKGSSVHLRASIISAIYAGNFGPKDVASVIEDYLCDDDRHAIGELWYLSDNVPTCDLSEIIDLLSEIQYGDKVKGNRHNNYEVEHCYTDFISRFLRESKKIKAAQVWKWLSTLNELREGVSTSNDKDKIRAWLVENNDFIFELFKFYLSIYSTDNKNWMFWRDFSVITMRAGDRKKIACEAFKTINDKVNLSEKDKLVFELVLQIAVYLDPPDVVFFETLFEYGLSHPELSEIQDRECFCVIDDWRRKDLERKVKKDAEHKKWCHDNRISFKDDIDCIKNGVHLNWLSWVAKVYFSQFTDVDAKASPEERLIEQLGSEYTNIAIEGLCSILKRKDLPTPRIVGENNVQGKCFTWWYAVVAGMDECWKRQPDYEAYPVDVLKSALAIDLVYPTYYKEENSRLKIIRGWKEELCLNHVDLVHSVYLEIIRLSLSAKKEQISEIYLLCADDRLSDNRGEAVIDLLHDYPGAHPQNLKRLLSAALSEPSLKKGLLDLALSVLNSRSKVRGNQRELWYSIVFLLSFDDFGDTAKRYAKKNKSIIWSVKSFIDNSNQVFSGIKGFKLSINQLAYLIDLICKTFNNVSHPVDGWSDNNNPWDAAEFARRLINDLSTRIDVGATEYLRAFLKGSGFNTYADHIKHALANQEALRRQNDFLQPDWNAAVEALSGGRPAHISDLHALTIVHLRDLIRSIRFGNTDIYKMFWNEDSYARIQDPKVEESCRDRLIDLLKPKFDPIEVLVEPEGHMVIDKRADIILLSPGKKLPLELKRDYHKDLWTACQNQLERLYARDPDASGYGIYVVFWFGDGRTANVPKPPKHIKRPETPEALEASLRSLIHPDYQCKLDVIVIDVTRPDG